MWLAIKKIIEANIDVSEVRINWHIKITTINILNKIEERMDKMVKNMKNLSREMESLQSTKWTC